jgi:NAD(P)-dependent dehydrogenase (short-subunit alcohol dehydrogenase family)
MIMATSLQDRTVVVIGRSSGIARAVADAATAAGAQVIVAGRDPESLAAAYDGKVRAIPLDLPMTTTVRSCNEVAMIIDPSGWSRGESCVWAWADRRARLSL